MAQMTRQLVDFEEWELLEDFEPPNPSIIVSGVLPFPMQVTIESRNIEPIREPEYWPADVAGSYEGAVPEVETPYTARASVSHLKRGSKGIVLIGATRSQNVDLP